MTAANRQEYVQLYTQWVLNDSVAKQFNAFAEGFREVRAALYPLQLLQHAAACAPSAYSSS